MSSIKTSAFLNTLLTPGLALALGLAFAASTALAIPYASGVKRTGDTVTFILNHAAASVEVLRDGANPVSPGTEPGLHSFSMAGFITFQIIVTGNDAPGWKQYVPDGTNTSFYVPLGVSINKNPSSPNFGKVYVSEAQGGAVGVGYRTTTSGIYVLNADGSDAGWADGGVDWAGAGNSAPFKSTIGPDGHLYVADLSRDLAFEFNDDLSVATQLIDETNRGVDQYVHGIWVEGTQAGGDRRIYLVNGNYNDTVGRGLIRYDLGAEAMAMTYDTGTPILTPAYYTQYYPFDVALDSNGDFYVNQYRATAGQAYPITKFNGAAEVPLDDDVIWEASDQYTGAYGIDINELTGRVAYGDYYTGGVFFFDMTTGEFVETFDAGNRIRELAFDAAGNLVTVDNSLEWARFWSPGGYTVATTSFDGAKSAFAIFKPASDVSVTAADTDAREAGPKTVTFIVTRTGDVSEALTVSYTMGGTSANGADYNSLPGSVTIPAGAASVDVLLTPIDDAEAELAETATLTLAASEDYSVVPPASATVTITDNETPTVDLEVVYPSMYERLAGDYARLRVVRRGDISAPSFVANLTYSGTAGGGRYNAPRSVTVDPDVVTQDFDITPIDDALLNGDQTIVATVVNGAGYAVGTTSPSATATILDDELPPEDVLWSEDFNTDVPENWTVQFGSANAVPDYRIGYYSGWTSFSYDYEFGGLIPSIPMAPHSASDTLGLYVTVNKDDPTALGAAGVNIYPKDKTFSGNYAVRFNMYLMVGNAASTTEYALFGINHSGTKANWFRNSAGGVPNNPTFDGLFFGVEADGAALGDYVIYSAPTTAGSNPTALTPGVNASTLTGIFKNPPFGGGLPGAPGNSELSETPCWVDVEISQVGNVITLTMNRTPILSYTNTTPFTSGNIMLGYCDAYDSIMAGNSCVVYDNLRVIRLAAPTTPPNITGIRLAGGNVEIDFAADSSDTPSAFALQSAGTVNGAYGDVSATITGSGGSFKAVRALDGAQRFYRIRRN